MKICYIFIVSDSKATSNSEKKIPQNQSNLIQQQ